MLNLISEEAMAYCTVKKHDKDFMNGGTIHRCGWGICASVVILL